MFARSSILTFVVYSVCVAAFLEASMDCRGQAPYNVARGSAATTTDPVTNAQGFTATAIGGAPDGSGTVVASGQTSFAVGEGAKSTGDFSVSFGINVLADGTGALAIGLATHAGGTYSTAFGDQTFAASYGELVIGQFNKVLSGSTAGSWTGTDDVFVIGNGTSTTATHNALEVDQSGNMTLAGALTVGTTATVNGNSILTSADRTGASLWMGTGSGADVGDSAYGQGAVASSSGPFGPSTAIGNGVGAGNGSATFGIGSSANRDSLAVGLNANVQATNVGSNLAVGINVGVDSYWSGFLTVVGVGSSGSGYSATAVGYQDIVEADGSAAIGYQNLTLGNYSTALGNNTTATGYAETVLGQYNDFTTATQTPDSWQPNDYLLVVGNGQSQTQTSNALVIQKNGAVAMGPGSVAGIAGQTVVGSYNDLRTNDNGTDHTQGVFIIGAGSNTAPQNALRILPDGTVLVKPSGDISMIGFTGGPTP